MTAYTLFPQMDEILRYQRLTQEGTLKFLQQYNHAQVSMIRAQISFAEAYNTSLMRLAQRWQMPDTNLDGASPEPSVIEEALTPKTLPPPATATIEEIIASSAETPEHHHEHHQEHHG